MKHISSSIGYRFAMLYRLNRYFISKELASLQITTSQVPFLVALFKAGGPLTQDDLSSEMEIDKAATARALDQLEKKGLIHRQVNPDCRRQKMVTVTQKAIALEPSFFKSIRSTGDIFFDGFSPRERETAFELLDRMMENARAHKYDNKTK